MEKPSILFVCTGNCCRSQMAEGLMRDLVGDTWEVCSAGSHPAGYVHPLCLDVLAEVGIEASSNTSWRFSPRSPRRPDHGYKK